MELNIPNSEKKRLGSIYSEVADLSRCFSFHTMAHFKDGKAIWFGQEYDEADKVLKHSVEFRPRSRNNQYVSECNVGFSGEFTHERDLFALEAMFAEFTNTQQLLVNGQYSGPSSFTITKRGKKYAYSMHVSTSTFKSMMLDKNGEAKMFGSVSGDAFANNFQIHLIVGKRTVPVATMSLWSGSKTAFEVAHDLAVIKALCDGRPEDEIRQMKPLSPVAKQDPEIAAREALELQEIHESMVNQILAE
jgi:hypothetical protein